MKKETSKILFAALSALLVCAIGFLGGTLASKLTDNEEIHYCLVKPLVYDAFTGKPLANATVINTADGKTYKTDESGSTDWIAVYYTDENELALNPFIAKCEGYKNMIMYAVCETGRDPLDGPMVYMFTAEEENETVSMVYAPSDEYSGKLFERFG